MIEEMCSRTGFVGLRDLRSSVVIPFMCGRSYVLRYFSPIAVRRDICIGMMRRARTDNAEIALSQGLERHWKALYFSRLFMLFFRAAHALKPRYWRLPVCGKEPANAWRLRVASRAMGRAKADALTQLLLHLGVFSTEPVYIHAGETNRLHSAD